MTFFIPNYLMTFTGGESEVEIESAAGDLRQVLTALWTRYPGLADRIVTEQGEVRQHVNIFVENESIRYTGGLDTRVHRDSKIYIVPAVSGGSPIDLERV